MKEVYLVQLLSQLEEHKVRSAMVFCATCRGCHLLSLVLEELDLSCAALHTHQTQGRRLAALDKCGLCPAGHAGDSAAGCSMSMSMGMGMWLGL